MPWTTSVIHKAHATAGAKMSLGVDRDWALEVTIWEILVKHAASSGMGSGVSAEVCELTLAA